MSPRFDEVWGAGALPALEADLAHPVLGACHATEVPDGFLPQAPRGAALLGLQWRHGGNASVAASPELWYFQWLDAGDVRGAGLVAHLALVLEDWGVAEARCLPLDQRAASLLRHCGFQSWADGPPDERHLLTVPVSTGAAYARRRTVHDPQPARSSSGTGPYPARRSPSLLRPTGGARAKASIADSQTPVAERM